MDIFKAVGTWAMGASSFVKERLHLAATKAPMEASVLPLVVALAVPKDRPEFAEQPVDASHHSCSKQCHDENPGQKEENNQSEGQQEKHSKGSHIFYF